MGREPILPVTYITELWTNISKRKYRFIVWFWVILLIFYSLIYHYVFKIRTRIHTK